MGSQWLGTAIQFLQAFPEAQAFSVTLLTEEKRTVVHSPQCSCVALYKDLGNLLARKEAQTCFQRDGHKRETGRDTKQREKAVKKQKLRKRIEKL